MCYCLPCCLIFGCQEFAHTINTPENYSEPPAKILCPCCGEITNAVYRKTSKTCGICFIPCCPCGSSEPFLACSKCNFALGGIGSENALDATCQLHSMLNIVQIVRMKRSGGQNNPRDGNNNGFDGNNDNTTDKRNNGFDGNNDNTTDKRNNGFDGNNDNTTDKRNNGFDGNNDNTTDKRNNSRQGVKIKDLKKDTKNQ